MIVKPRPTDTTVIKDGTYQATLADIRQFQNSYGDRIGFTFRIEGGPFDGAKVMRSTAPQLSKASKLAEMIEGVLGRSLTDRELIDGFDLDKLKGNQCSILVLQSRSKGGQIYSNIERVFQG